MADQISIVDDNEAMAKFLTVACLELNTVSVKNFSSGAGFMQAVENFGLPDLTILDLNLHDMRGEMVLKNILQIDPFAKVIVITADEEKRDEVLKLGASEFVNKPFSVSKLLDIVKAQLSVE